MFTVTINSGNEDFNTISYYIVKLTKYTKTELDDHDYILADDVEMSFMYKKIKINVKTYRSKEIVGLQYRPGYLRYLELSSDIKTIQKFIKKAHDVYYKDHFYKENTISIWTPADGRWNFYANLKMRDVDSVILDNGIKEDIINDLEQFNKNENIYNKYGIPYKRVYCLYGPPGTGKSSIIFTIASKFKKNIAMLNFGSGITDSSFIKLMANLPNNTILLLEDIDALFSSRESISKSDNGFLSFSTLLNILDGNLRVEGLCTFMTTNHPEKLDSALLRKGRVDYMVKIDYISKYQIEHFAKMYYPNITKKQLDEYIGYLSKIKNLTSSQLSSFMFLHLNIPFDELMTNIKKEFKK
jgi:chaperone BCS1